MSLKIENFGNNLKSIRKKSGYTQESLAEASNVAHSYIIKIENGQDTPGIDTAIKISNTLQVPLEFFLKDEGIRLYETYANIYMIEEMNKLNEEKFHLLSDTLFSLYKIFSGDNKSLGE